MSSTLGAATVISLVAIAILVYSKGEEFLVAVHKEMDSLLEQDIQDIIDLLAQAKTQDGNEIRQQLLDKKTYYMNLAQETIERTNDQKETVSSLMASDMNGSDEHIIKLEKKFTIAVDKQNTSFKDITKLLLDDDGKDENRDITEIGNQLINVIKKHIRPMMQRNKDIHALFQGIMNRSQEIADEKERANTESIFMTDLQERDEQETLELESARLEQQAREQARLAEEARLAKEAEEAETPVVEPAETPVVEPAETLAVEPAETPVVEPAETLAVEPVETPAVEPAETLAVEPAETPAEEPAETLAVEPAESPVEEPAETPAEETAETPVEEPAETPAEETAETPAEEPAETPAEETAETPAEEPAESPVEEPTESPVEEPAESPVEEPAESPVEEPAESPVEEPAKTSVEEATRFNIKFKGSKSEINATQIDLETVGTFFDTIGSLLNLGYSRKPLQSSGAREVIEVLKKSDEFDINNLLQTYFKNTTELNRKKNINEVISSNFESRTPLVVSSDDDSNQNRNEYTRAVSIFYNQQTKSLESVNSSNLQKDDTREFVIGLYLFNPTILVTTKEPLKSINKTMLPECTLKYCTNKPEKIKSLNSTNVVENVRMSKPLVELLVDKSPIAKAFMGGNDGIKYYNKDVQIGENTIATSPMYRTQSIVTLLMPIILIYIIKFTRVLFVRYWINKSMPLQWSLWTLDVGFTLTWCIVFTMMGWIRSRVLMRAILMDTLISQSVVVISFIVYNEMSEENKNKWRLPFMNLLSVTLLLPFFMLETST
jgi:hypothetical protein